MPATELQANGDILHLTMIHFQFVPFQVGTLIGIQDFKILIIDFNHHSTTFHYPHQC